MGEREKKEQEEEDAARNSALEAVAAAAAAAAAQNGEDPEDSPEYPDPPEFSEPPAAATASAAAVVGGAVKRSCSNCSSVPVSFEYCIQPGGDVEAWFRNVRRRIEVELMDGGNLELVQETVTPHGPRAGMAAGLAPRVLPAPSSEAPVFRYVLRPGEDVAGYFEGLQRRIEAELGEGATVQ